MPSFTKISMFAIVFAAVTGNVTAVGCFSGGQTGDCSSVISTFCGSDRIVAGGAVFSECFNVNNYHCDLQIQNTASNSMTISAAVCQADLLVTNNGCNSHGGIRQDGNFLLTVDPNAGSCSF